MKSTVPHQGISALRHKSSLCSPWQSHTLQAGSHGSSPVTSHQTEEGDWGHTIYHFYLGKLSPLDDIETRGHTKWIWLQWQMNDENEMGSAIVTNIIQKWRNWAALNPQMNIWFKVTRGMWCNNCTWYINYVNSIIVHIMSMDILIGWGCLKPHGLK